MANTKLVGLGLFAAGAGIGAGIGAVVALLYAPRAGKHTRRRLQNSADQTLNEIAAVRDDVREYMTEWVDETSEAIAASVTSGSETLKEGADNTLRTLDKVRERMETGRDRVEEYIRSVAG